MSNGKTCDLTLKDITVTGTLGAADKVAGLIAQAPTYSNNGSKLTVTNCVNKAMVSGTRAAGICCSINTDKGNTFTTCINEGTINATTGKYRTAAGILCKNEAGTVFNGCENKGILNASIAYSIATKLVITFTADSSYRSGEARVKAGDTYYYTMSNPNIENMYNLFVGTPYSATSAVDWEQVCRTAHSSDYVGLGAGKWYDTANTKPYTVTVTAPNYTTLRYFKSLDEAFEHDLSNATVTLLADQILTKTKADQMTYTLDLNGHKLTAKSTIHDGINGGTVTVKNGTLVNESSSKLFEITNLGTLKLEGVTLAAEGVSIINIASSYTGTVIFDGNCKISGRIDLGENNTTKVVINDTTFHQTDGRYVSILENVISR